MLISSSIINYSLYGLKVTSFRESDLLDEFSNAIRESRKITCYGYSLTVIPRFRSFPQIYYIAETFDVMVADGKGFFHLCRAFGIPLQSDWALYEVSDALLCLAEKEKFSVMLLGSDADSNKLATQYLKVQYPSATILEGYHGYFEETEEPHILEHENRLKPDILLIGMSSPKKEKFVVRNIEKLNASVIVLIGGVIDIYAGKTKPIPLIVKNLCLTWIYRFIQEPKRLCSLMTGGISILFRLIPTLLWIRWIKKDTLFSIPAYLGISKADTHETLE